MTSTVIQSVMLYTECTHNGTEYFVGYMYQVQKKSVLSSMILSQSVDIKYLLSPKLSVISQNFAH